MISRRLQRAAEHLGRGIGNCFSPQKSWVLSDPDDELRFDVWLKRKGFGYPSDMGTYTRFLAQWRGDDEAETTEATQLIIEAAEVRIDFSCRVCGEQCAVAPQPPERAICEVCCQDHEYEYDRDTRSHRCVHCDRVAGPDFYDD